MATHAELLSRGQASRVFQKDADKATASVLFCLAEAAKIVGALKPEPGAGGRTLSFNDFYQALPGIAGTKPWMVPTLPDQAFTRDKPGRIAGLHETPACMFSVTALA